jgi:lipoprotein NlpD
VDLSMTPRGHRRTLVGAVAATIVAVLLCGCASPSYRAPVEDRSASPGARRGGPPSPAVAQPSGEPAPAVSGPVASSNAVPATPETAKLLPGAENAGKPGYYTVKAGDTLIRVGLETGQNWRDIVRWNSLDNPNVVEVGQVLRVLPPEADPATASVRAVAPPKVETRTLDGLRTAAASPSRSPGSSAAPAAPAPPTAPSAGPSPATPPLSEPTPIATLPRAPSISSSANGNEVNGEIAWLWPASGDVVKTFDEGRSNGLAIAGKAGDPVVAAADGRIVYAGSGLRGYGNLVIVKHNATFLTAYAHNQTLLVKDEQSVKRGQKIAEMGSTDTDRVQLHFEIRKQGKPIDPTRLLPPR